jgi:hypothetical protein
MVAKSYQTKAPTGHKAEESYSKPFQELSVPSNRRSVDWVGLTKRNPTNICFLTLLQSSPF